MNVDPKLGNQSVCKGELSQSVCSNCELADAHNSHTKLRDGKDATVVLSAPLLRLPVGSKGGGADPLG